MERASQYHNLVTHFSTHMNHNSGTSVKYQVKQIRLTLQWKIVYVCVGWRNHSELLANCTLPLNNSCGCAKNKKSFSCKP